MQKLILLVWVSIIGAAQAVGPETTAVGALKKNLYSVAMKKSPEVVTTASQIIATKKSVDLAQQSVVLKNLAKQLKEHAAIAPTKKGMALKNLAGTAQKEAETKKSAAISIVQKSMPASLKTLNVIKKNSHSSLKKKAVTEIKKSLDRPNTMSPMTINRALNNNLKKSIEKGKRAVKVLKKMLHDGEAVHPKRATIMVRKALGDKPINKYTKAVKTKLMKNKAAISYTNFKKMNKALKKTAMCDNNLNKALKRTAKSGHNPKKTFNITTIDSNAITKPMIKKTGKKVTMAKKNVIG